MSVLDNADAGGGSDLPEIANSIRLDGTNDYLSRTFGTPTNQNTWTYSVWVKRGLLGTWQGLYNSPSSGGYGLWFSALDQIYLQQGASGGSSSTAVFRDTSSHLHVVMNCNGTNTTVYVNNQSVLVRASTLSPLNTSGAVVNIGRNNNPGQEYFDGYLSNICFIDGQALTPSSFAYTDSNGQWRSLAGSALASLASAGGTNSFFLDFSDGSSTTTLGNDASSKNNDWTLTNMVRDGSVNDCWSYDTPTNNFATWNTVDKSPNITVLNGGLDTNNTSGGYQSVRASIGVASGKWYWEVTNCTMGTGISSDVTSLASTNIFLANLPTAWIYASNATKYNNGVGAAYGATFTSTDILGVALDIDAGTLTFYKNGASQGVAYSTGLTGQVMFPATCTLNIQPNGTINCGQRPVSGGAWDSAAGGYFRYAPPSGFKALCTKNLPVSGSVTTSGTFTGNASADGPCVWLNGTPTAMTIDGNAVTWGTHADKLAGGFKIRTASSPYNDAASNSYTVTTNAGIFKFNNAEGNP